MRRRWLFAARSRRRLVGGRAVVRSDRPRPYRRPASSARAALWIPSFAVMGVACRVNARGCGRLHCFVTGPLFLLASLATVLDALAVLSISWKITFVSVAVGTLLAYGLEWIHRKYVTSSVPWLVRATVSRLSGSGRRRSTRLSIVAARRGGPLRSNSRTSTLSRARAARSSSRCIHELELIRRGVRGH